MMKMDETRNPKIELEHDLKNLISGEWVDSDSKIEVLNPYTDKVIGTVPRMGLQDVYDQLY